MASRESLLGELGHVGHHHLVPGSLQHDLRVGLKRRSVTRRRDNDARELHAVCQYAVGADANRSFPAHQCAHQAVIRDVGIRERNGVGHAVTNFLVVLHLIEAIVL